MGLQFKERRRRSDGRRVLVWNSIILNGKIKCHIFSGYTVTSERYCQQVIRFYVHLFGWVIGTNFLFIDDNAGQHLAHAVNELL